MFKNVTIALSRAIWLFAFSLLVAIALYPVSNRTTRMGALALFLIVWIGLIAFTWRWKGVRFALLGITALVGGFLVLPGRASPGAAVLRQEYAEGMRRYDGVTYYWGGENWRGIDCSGLIRRGLIDSLFWRGMRTFDAGMVRRSLSLWWNDTTAKTLGEAPAGLTTHVLETESLNALDHSKILPGDMAVTRNGIHILAYLGDKKWIEADPAVGSVITVGVPSKDVSWFNIPMKVVRWDLLRE